MVPPARGRAKQPQTWRYERRREWGGLVPLLPRWGPVVEPETHMMLVIWKVLSSCKPRRPECVCLLLCRVEFARIMQARGRRPGRTPRHLSQREAGDGHRAPGDWCQGCPSELQVRTLFTKAEANTDPRRPSNQKGKEKKSQPAERHWKARSCGRWKGN